MNKVLSWKILIPLGVLLIILGQGGVLAFLGWIIVLMGVIDLFRIKEKMNTSPTSSKMAKDFEKAVTQISLSEKPTYPWQSKPREGTEAHRVEQEVQKRKKIAEDKKVKELISELYFSGIKHYPSWIKTDHNRHYVPTSILIASESKEKVENKSDKKITKIVLKGKSYKFMFQENTFSTPDGEYHTHGLLELFLQDQKILAINTSLEHSEYDSKWRPFGIEAFIDGDWIEDFVQLRKQIDTDEKLRQITQAEDPKKVERMKKDFGIK